tara:strand:- start:897 stop:1580 length:684 start_codon:yes stop_codon:yes gene_type:complete
MLKKNSITSSILFLGLNLVLISPNYSQSIEALSAPSLGDELPTLNIGDTGTINQTVSNGSKASLTFGSSTSFGASANLNSTPGTKSAVTTSVSLEDTSGISNKITNTLGTSSTNESGNRISANISNLRANNESPDNGLSSTDSNFSNGSALLEGITSSNELVLDDEETLFEVKLSTVHDQSLFEDVSSINVDNSTSLGSGSASAVVNNQTVVDINTSQFVSTFQQAY